MENLQELVGWNLKKLRLKAELTQVELAVDAQMDPAHVSRIERGVENPTIGVLARLTAALEVPITELFKPQRGGPLPDRLKRGRKKVV